VVSLLSVVLSTRLCFNTNSRGVLKAIIMAREIAYSAAVEVEDALNKVPVVAQSISNDLNTGVLPDDKVGKRMIRELELNPQLGAVTVAYCPEFVPDFFTAPFSY
jgi:hypothetical protein